MELYWASGSPYAWRAQLALELKGLPYTSHLLQFSTGDLKKPAYLAMNPRGRVPVLVDGDYTVYESMAILAYLDRNFPEKPLFGRDAREAGTIARFVAECACYVEAASERFLLPLYGWEPMDEAKVRAAADELRPELARLEAALIGRRFLVGDTVTAADIAYFPLIPSIVRAAGKPAAADLDLGFLPLADTFPAIAAWVARFEPLSTKTWPPHWR